MWLIKAVKFVNSVLKPLNWFLGGVGAGILTAMMFLIAADVILRYLFGKPIAASYEISEFMMVMTVSLGIFYCAVHKGHITVDIIVSRFPQRFQVIIGVITSFFALGLFLLIIWRFFLLMKDAFDSHLVSAVLSIPLFPFMGVAALVLCAFWLALLAEFLNFLSRALKK